MNQQDNGKTIQGSDQQASTSGKAERITSLQVGTVMYAADPATNKISMQIEGGDKQWLEPQQVVGLSNLLSQYQGQTPS